MAVPIQNNTIKTNNLSTRLTTVAENINTGTVVRGLAMVTGTSFLGAIALCFTKFCSEAFLSFLKIGSRAIKMEKESREKLDATFNSYVSFVDNLGGSGIKGTFDRFFGNDFIRATGVITGSKYSELSTSNVDYEKVEEKSIKTNPIEKDGLTADNQSLEDTNNAAGLNKDGTQPTTSPSNPEASSLQGSNQQGQSQP